MIIHFFEREKMREREREKGQEKQERKKRKNATLGCVVDQTPKFLERLLEYENRIGISELLEGINLGGSRLIPGFLGLYV